MFNSFRKKKSNFHIIVSFEIDLQVNCQQLQLGGELKCSVMVKMFTAPLRTCRKFSRHTIEWKHNFYDPSPVQSCHSIDMHIWGRITQKGFASPLWTFKNVCTSPKVFQNISCHPYFNPPPFPTIIVNNSLRVLFLSHWIIETMGMAYTIHNNQVLEQERHG